MCLAWMSCHLNQTWMSASDPVLSTLMTLLTCLNFRPSAQLPTDPSFGFCVIAVRYEPLALFVPILPLLPNIICSQITLCGMQNQTYGFVQSSLVSCICSSHWHSGEESNYVTLLLKIKLSIVFRIKSKLLSMEFQRIFIIQLETLAISSCSAYALAD